MNSADLVVTHCDQLLTCKGPAPKRGRTLQQLEIIEDGGIASLDGKIVFVGRSDDLQRTIRLKDRGECIDARGMTALPGFIDPHTHLPFAGSRDLEFSLRLQGYTYQQLAKKGMGIQTSVKTTRDTSLEELVSLCLSRLDSMLLHGTTTIEAKSGYGLNRSDEIKQLQAIRKADSLHAIDIVPTFLGAHEIPPEYKTDKESYINLLIDAILPEVKEKKLAEAVDVFCEEGVYSVDETKRILKASKELGFAVRIHADEFVSLGGAELAAAEGALSADHLMAISEEGILALARSDTTAILLPAVSFFLMQEKKAPARKLIESGAAVALASDFNPGSSMTESIPFVLQLAVFTLKMGIEEAVHAVTANAAYSLRRQDSIGSLEVGKSMDMILCDIPHFRYLAYHPGVNPVHDVIKKGKIVVRDRRLILH